MTFETAMLLYELFTWMTKFLICMTVPYMGEDFLLKLFKILLGSYMIMNLGLANTQVFKIDCCLLH